jgi:transposase InsO family protein
MTNAVVEQALFQAVVIQRPPADLIHPSDRGSQYCSPRYQRILKQFGMTASMSRRGNCYDNAPMENFWGTLKRGLVASRLSRRSPNTSRFFTTVNGAIPDRAIYRQRHLHSSTTTEHNRQHDAIYGVHI